MGRGKEYQPEQMVNLLRQIEVAIANGNGQGPGSCRTSLRFESQSSYLGKGRRRMLAPSYEFKDWRLTMKTCKVLAMGIVLFAALVSANLSRAGAKDTKALLLFGGADHKTFLGCLNCTSVSSESVCNDYGKGSEYASESIWNRYGTYGSEYSEYSPWNSYYDSAPIIVDRDGKSFGYFSVNAYHHDRTRIDWLVAL